MHVNRIPRPPGPMLRSVAAIARDPLTHMPRLARELGDIYQLELPLLRTVVINHPDDVHQVLVRDFRSYRKDFFTRQLREVLGDGLLTAEGERWRRHRRLSQPSFHGRAIRGYAETMVRHADEQAERWGERQPVDLHVEMMALTLRIVARTLFGHEVTGEADRVGHALESLMHVFMGVGGSGIKVPACIPTPGNRRLARAVAELDQVVYGIIDEHRRGDRDPDTLLGLLIASTDADGGLTDAELRDEALTLLMAGHETTAGALTMAFYLLSQHPGAEEELHAELDTVLEGRLPTLEDLARLPYTRNVVLETMRLYPPAWSIAREALVDTEIRGYTIPRGTQVWMSQWVLHRDPRFFDEPERFLPDRWLGGDLEKTLPDCAYMPFSAGPRVCIGKRFAELEAILVLATLARRAALRLEPGAKLDLIPSVTLRPEGGLRMVASARKRVKVAA